MPEGLRIALLGRAGEARDHLRRALADLGADIVVEGDPVELDPGTVGDTRPGVLVISLDSAMEEQLDRWDGLLDDPSINVVFDEAEVTRRLSGWDLARWARHLASKVMRAGDLLPPPPAEAERVPDRYPLPQPGAPPTPAELMADARLEDYTRDTAEMAADVPSGPLLTELGDDGDGSMPDDAGLEVETLDAEALGLDLDEIDSAFGRDVGVGTWRASMPAPSAEADAATFELDADLQALERALELGASGERVDFSAMPGADEAQSASGHPSAAGDDEPSPSREAEAAPASGDTAGAGNGASLFGALELVPLDDESESMTQARPAGNGTSAPAAAGTASASAPAAAPAPAPALSFEDMLSGFGLTDGPVVAGEARGAILLVSGVGGPDGVRQFLGALPERLPVPVLVHQQLEAGNHDRLAPQMARASRLPVYLAEPGAQARVGEVAILPSRVALEAVDGDPPAFVEGEATPVSLVETLAVFGRDVVVVVLSGADPDVVGPIAALAANGALALAQDPATCFDGKAASALHQQGFVIAAPAELAMRAVQHWSA
ncbi:chemotaxis protein CheB [Rehaibacterium terrae]|jgi:chemosensory pili system protein ChpB (putative protein-glutamate methylesterase)|uniref:protein-glutamate methylesterase n=1 Tax=Rehaibacterium terrae TaxID=1341696 RepID=A0A7W8DEW1_9GAMM|nr:chemotaxis protein CheB [Rehaibacterium terrae]MBB5015901.1 chemosensory pili system protein ChpB (putative protein-glutamate methylesterase) [Rehaibacterium terrae]